MKQEKKTYTIKELAAAGGVSRRTVRYYVTRGLIPPPTGTGRGPHYTEQHLRSLRWVKEQQENGTALAEILAGLERGEGPHTPELPTPSPEPVSSPVPALGATNDTSQGFYSEARDHLRLAAGVELVVGPAAPNDLVELLVNAAAQWRAKQTKNRRGHDS